MKLALMSDIHANLPALEAVLADIESRDVSAVYHLGDLVGYAPWPNETVAKLTSAGIGGIGGNYDTTVATDYKHCGCRYEDPHQEELAHLSYEWTRSNVTPETKRALGSLPFRLDITPFGGHLSGPKVILVHGTPALNTVYWTQDRSDEFCMNMARTAGMKTGDAIAFGHTHLPWHREVSGMHFVNTGSVDRPKDGDSRAGYVLLDVSENGVSVEFLRVEYDVKRAAEAIRASSLPSEFADHLLAGSTRQHSSAAGSIK